MEVLLDQGVPALSCPSHLQLLLTISPISGLWGPAGPSVLNMKA